MPKTKLNVIYNNAYCNISDETQNNKGIIRNVKSSPCLINWALLQEDMLESRGTAPSFLTSAPDGGEWSASRSGSLPLGKKPKYPLDRRLGGPQRRSRSYGAKKYVTPTENLTPAVHPTARRYTDRAIPAPHKGIRNILNRVHSISLFNLQKKVRTRYWLSTGSL
jgi:hypothetical protein